MVIALVTALAATLAVGAYLRSRVAETTQALLPAFLVTPKGPLAPAVSALGVRVGLSHLPDAQNVAKALKAQCGVGGAKPAPRPAGSTDAITTPSWALVSAGERSPRVVWRCHVRSPPGDRVRPPVGGELLFAFDSPTHSLRHASFARVHTDAAAARLDLDGSVQWMRSRFGAPTQPAQVPAALPANRLDWQWRFADLVVQVSSEPGGDRFVVREALEVPWPVRAGIPAPR